MRDICIFIWCVFKLSHMYEMKKIARIKNINDRFLAVFTCIFRLFFLKHK